MKANEIERYASSIRILVLSRRKAGGGMDSRKEKGCEVTLLPARTQLRSKQNLL
jgi:hypothetical protein